MSEPTIDEMLAIVDSAIFNCTPADGVRLRAAIHAILEQRKNMVDFAEPYVQQRELEAIRAFVERVRAQREFADISYGKAIQDELAAMEANDRTND